MKIERDLFWDNLKGFLIILVVMGHVLQLGNDELSITMVNWIYTFHMPLFVFISGFFSNPQSRNYKKGIVNLLEIYFFFHLIHLSITGSFNFYSLIRPSFSLWYLLSMVFWKLLLYFKNYPGSIRISNSILVIGSFIICFISTFIPLSTELSFQRTFAYLPFFMLGYVTRDAGIKPLLSKIHFSLAFVSVIIIAIFCYFIHKSLLLPLSNSLSISTVSLFVLFKYRLISIVLGLVMSIFFLKIFSMFNGFVILSRLGEYSLFIYLFHAFFYLYLIKPMVERGILPHDFISLILYSFVIIVILYYASRIKILNELLNLINYLYTRWKDRS